ncbi:aldo/keto reductase [Salinisphaera sp. USBA-960]|nr:aldo/keto reductase [Salifodinibacter halophilus]NNC27172.1 aldo/keto reductase [Salifodinibacter halophilus]
MHYRNLGQTGLKVSELCLGTMTFGTSFKNIAEVEQRDADELVERALDAGVNFFDTADMYSRGESEVILGQAFKNLGVDRDKVVIATKLRAPMSEDAAYGTGDVNNVGLSRKHIMASIDASLKRLDTGYIDLYQAHGWDQSTPLEETLKAFDDLVRMGKVLYPGCSNWPARHIARALAICEHRGWASFISLQAYYALAGRDLEHELLPLAREQGLGVMPWSPLAGGMLSGKFRRDQAGPEGARRTDFNFPPVDERVFDAVDVLEAVANETGASTPQIALAWTLAQPGVTSTIIGANKRTQLDDNLDAVNVTLSDEQLARLNDVTAPTPLYPAWMVERQNSAH